MADSEGIDLEQLRVLADRAGLNMTADEVQSLKPMFDAYAKRAATLHEIELGAGDPAVAFSPDWDPQS